ncbi:MAG: hypothetical protein ACRBCI_11640 [Cellvibrionaceae bacterium]
MNTQIPNIQTQQTSRITDEDLITYMNRGRHARSQTFIALVTCMKRGFFQRLGLSNNVEQHKTTDRERLCCA